MAADHSQPGRRRRPPQRILIQRPAPPLEAQPGLEALAQRAHGELLLTHPRLWRGLAVTLGVQPAALLVLGVGYVAHRRLFTWPMLNAAGDVVGLRTRDRAGRKRAITGSRHGLFWVPGGPLADPVLVVEGPTDTAAALDLGFSVVGRAAAQPGAAADAELGRLVAGHDVVVVADGDAAGKTGADLAVQAVVRGVRRVRVLHPCRHKDLRAAVCAGLTRSQLAGMIDGAEPVRLDAEGLA